MASRKRAKKSSAKKKSVGKSRAKRGTSPLARMAHARGMTIAELRGAIEPCGRYSVRRRKPTRKSPCR